jgi:hypothetical protein
VTTGDERYINVLFEVDKNPSPSQYPVNCVKRPGLSTSTRPFGAAATGRGVYYWNVTGDIYSVFGASTFVNTSTLVSSMATATGRVWFQPIHEDTGQAKLMISDGAIDYQVVSTNVISTTSTFGSTTHLGSAAELDGFYLHGFRDGKIRNTAVNTVSTWPTAGFLTADTYGSDLEVIYRQKDQVIGFTKNRIEFFFNNGNPTNSPLLRIDQNTLDFGIAHKNTLAWAGETACFVSENAGNGDGGRSVYMIQSLGKVVEVTTPHINRILAAEGLSISSCSAWMERVAGQLVYCLNLAAADRSFVFSVDEKMWCEWQNAVSTRFNGVSATSKNGVTYIQDVSSGYIHTVSETVYQDAGANFTVMLQTPRSNFGSAKRKYETELDVIGDTSTGNLKVSVSNDDFATFSTPRDIDMSKASKNLTRLGAFYSRAHRFTYTANGPFRVQAFMPEIKDGI